jgi:hypothetical protein
VLLLGAHEELAIVGEPPEMDLESARNWLEARQRKIEREQEWKDGKDKDDQYGWKDQYCPRLLVGPAHHSLAAEGDAAGRCRDRIPRSWW